VYSAFWCSRWRLLASMRSADRCPYGATSSKLAVASGFGRSRSDRSRHHAFVHLADRGLQPSTFQLRGNRIGRVAEALAAHHHRPDDARIFVGECHGRDVHRSTIEQARQPREVGEPHAAAAQGDLVAESLPAGPLIRCEVGYSIFWLVGAADPERERRRRTIWSWREWRLRGLASGDPGASARLPRPCP
jgi:hypothetical protein